jgi:O-antigen/teichoic acid export membrane protein
MTVATAVLAPLAVILLGLAVTRPAKACAVLAFAVPVTTGLGRGTLIPLLRPNEAIALIVFAGVLVNRLPRRNRQGLNALDIATAAFAGVGVLVPALVLVSTHSRPSVDTWTTVLSPLQFLGFYLLFSRVPFSESDFRLCLNLAMAAAVVVAAVAAAQLLDLPGVRDAVATYYPTPAPANGDTTYRPDSLLGHYSAVGGLALLTCLLAVALAAIRHRGFSPLWLLAVAGANVIGLIASQTLAPLVVLPLATVIVLLLIGRLPLRMTLGLLGGGAAAALLMWPAISQRLEDQGLISAGKLSLLLPETLQTRLFYWKAFIVPALADHLWFGSGTVIPGSVPDPLTSYVDNEYLWAGFRAGIPGIAVLLLLLGVVFWQGARRRGADPSRQAIGAAAAAAAFSIVLLGITAQYVTFGGVTQMFAMLVGLLAGLSAHRSEAAPALVVAPARPPRTLAAVVADGARGAVLMAIPPWLPPARPPARGRTPGEWPLLSSSAVVFAGFSLARLLGFLFSVVTARLLEPVQFGHLTFAFAIIGLTSVLVSSSPLGLSSFLSRHRSESREQNRYFANWVGLVGLLAGGSAIVAVGVSLADGVGPLMALGVAANIFGIACLETYREAQRGLGRYWSLVTYYVAANLVQLVAVVALVLLRWRSPELCLFAYGTSSIVAMLVVERVMPLTLSAAPRYFSWSRIRRTARFVAPIMVQSVFFAAWIWSDLILVQHLMGPAATGNYGAAKTLVNVLLLAPSAIATAVGPRVVRLADRALRRYLAYALLLTAVASIPLAVGLAVLAGPVIEIMFGPKYPLAAAAVPILGVGMTLYSFYSVLGSIWVGLGRPTIDPISTATGMVVAVFGGLVLIPMQGLHGAALAFTLGSGARLSVMVAYTLWSLVAGTFASAERLRDRSRIGEQDKVFAGTWHRSRS